MASEEELILAAEYGSMLLSNNQDLRQELKDARDEIRILKRNYKALSDRHQRERSDSLGCEMQLQWDMETAEQKCLRLMGEVSRLRESLDAVHERTPHAGPEAGAAPRPPLLLPSSSAPSAPLLRWWLLREKLEHRHCQQMLIYVAACKASQKQKGSPGAATSGAGTAVKNTHRVAAVNIPKKRAIVSASQQPRDSPTSVNLNKNRDPGADFPEDVSYFDLRRRSQLRENLESQICELSSSWRAGHLRTKIFVRKEFLPVASIATTA